MLLIYPVFHQVLKIINLGVIMSKENESGQNCASNLPF